jgi:hypothetical protein
LTSYQNKWFVLLVILAALVAFLVYQKVLAPRNAEAQVTSTSTHSTDFQTATSTLEKLPIESLSSKIEKLVREEFSDIPILIKIASCESQFRQFDTDGTVLRGKVNPLDRGLFQINEKYHLEASKRLGIDIYTLKGNMAYARHLYEQSGTTPWNWSKECWSV